MSDNLKAMQECGLLPEGEIPTNPVEMFVDHQELKERLEEYTSRILASQQAAHEAELREKILELEQRVKVLTLVCELAAKEPVGLLKSVATNALNQTPKQTAAQIERWHAEWMMKLPVMARMIHRKNAVHGLLTDLARTYDEYGEGGWPDTWKEGAKLVAIPTLPKESKDSGVPFIATCVFDDKTTTVRGTIAETDLDEALRRQ